MGAGWDGCCFYYLWDYCYCAISYGVILRKMGNKEFYVTKEFIQGDCIEEIPKLNKHFDLVLTDPPYNIGWKYSKKVNDKKEDYNEWCLKWA